MALNFLYALAVVADHLAYDRHCFRVTLFKHSDFDTECIFIGVFNRTRRGFSVDGKIGRNNQIRVVRDGIVVFEDKISSLRRFKDDVREVASGYECGIGLDRFNDMKPGDILEAFVMVEVER